MGINISKHSCKVHRFHFLLTLQISLIFFHECDLIIQIDRCRYLSNSCSDTGFWIFGLCSYMHFLLDIYGNNSHSCIKPHMPYNIYFCNYSNYFVACQFLGYGLNTIRNTKCRNTLHLFYGQEQISDEFIVLYFKRGHVFF